MKRIFFLFIILIFFSSSYAQIQEEQFQDQIFSNGTYKVFSAESKNLKLNKIYAGNRIKNYQNNEKNYQNIEIIEDSIYHYYLDNNRSKLTSYGSIEVVGNFIFFLPTNSNEFSLYYLKYNPFSSIINFQEVFIFHTKNFKSYKNIPIKSKKNIESFKSMINNKAEYNYSEFGITDGKIIKEIEVSLDLKKSSIVTLIRGEKYDIEILNNKPFLVETLFKKESVLNFKNGDNSEIYKEEIFNNEYRTLSERVTDIKNNRNFYDEAINIAFSKNEKYLLFASHALNRIIPGWIPTEVKNNIWAAEMISPNLTRSWNTKKSFINNIYSKNSDLIIIGTSDGLIHLTRDGGSTWLNVTPIFKKLNISNGNSIIDLVKIKNTENVLEYLVLIENDNYNKKHFYDEVNNLNKSISSFNTFEQHFDEFLLLPSRINDTLSQKDNFPVYVFVKN